MAQVAKRDVCIPQDGRVVEAVCMECTNCGGGYEVSPQRSMRAASRGFPPAATAIFYTLTGNGLRKKGAYSIDQHSPR